MTKFYLIFLLIPAVGYSAAYTASQSGTWNSGATWGGAGIPGFGDTVSIPQYVVTIPASTTASIGTVNTTSLTIGDRTHAASLVINGTLNLRGTGNLEGAIYDCLHNPAVNIGTGGTLNLDENGGSSPSGFVIPSSTAPCLLFSFGREGDVCTWGTSLPTCPTNVNSINNGSANGTLLTDNGTGFGATQVNWNGTALNSCGANSTSVAGCFQAEMYQAASSWDWNQVYLDASAAFGTNSSTALPNDSSPVSIKNTISSGRLQNTDVFFGSECSHGTYGAFTPGVTPAGSNVTANACTGTRSITNSLIRDTGYGGFGGDPFTAGATIQNVFFEGLATNGYYSSLTGANVAGGSWSYVVAWGDAASACDEGNNTDTILAPVADHIYAICPSSAAVPLLLTMGINKNWGTNGSLTNAIFDIEFNSGTNGHSFIFGNDGVSDTGYSMTMSYITVLINPTLGYGLSFTAWSSVCPAAPLTSITHLLQPGAPATASWYACENSGVASPTTLLSVFKGNIFYDTVARTNPLMFGDSVPASQPANVVPPTGVDYNANYNFLPFAISPYRTACASGCTNGGGPYAVPMTGSAPGAHDQNIDPGLLDNSRNGYTWAALRGQAASATGFRQVFINDGPSAIGANIAALFYYIDRGNIPGRTLWNAMPDGTTIGPSQPVMFPRGIRTVTR